MKKRTLKIIISCLIVALLLVSAVFMLKYKSNSSIKTENSTNKHTVEKDIDGNKLSDQSFYGDWIADSEKAQSLFGDLKISFNEDGTYSAVVTGESISGTWTRDKDTITTTDPDEILPCTFTYTEDGNLKMICEDL